MTSAMPATGALSTAAIELLDALPIYSWTEGAELSSDEHLRAAVPEFVEQAERLSAGTPLWRVVIVDSAAGPIASTLDEYALHPVEVEARAGEVTSVVRGVDLLRQLLID